jgi:hypothetical protein
MSSAEILKRVGNKGQPCLLLINYCLCFSSNYCAFMCIMISTCRIFTEDSPLWSSLVPMQVLQPLYTPFSASDIFANILFWNMPNTWSRAMAFISVRNNRWNFNFKYLVIIMLCVIYYKYYVFGHYPSSCPLFKKPQRFGDWILSPSSRKTYSVGSNR